VPLTTGPDGCMRRLCSHCTGPLGIVGSMKRAVVLAAVLLVILVGVPIIGGMTMPDCPECHLSAGEAVGMCLAVLALLSLVVPGVFMAHVQQERALRLLLLRAGVERPPRPQ
jgi:hypothetical protein